MKRREWMMLISIAALVVALIVQERAGRSAKRSWREAELTREGACSVARSAALERVRGQVVLERHRRKWAPQLEPHPPGGEVGVYVFACGADHRDTRTQDMAGRVGLLIDGLFAVGDLDALDRVLALLNETPLVGWKDLDLPEEPSLWLELGRGDAAAARALEDRYLKSP